MKVLFAAAESAPFYKTGGLGDVAAALPHALLDKGVDIRVVLPYYSLLMPERYLQDIEDVTQFTVNMGGRDVFVGIKMITLNDLPIYFIDNEEFFGRDHLYGDWDDGGRFGFFQLAILEMLQVINFIPDIIHVNDWHTAMIPVLLKEKYGWVEPYQGIRTQLTIHNLQFQGWFPESILDSVLGIGHRYFNDDGFAQDGQVNFLKGGINFADRVNTVSPTYAREIQTEYFGDHLDGTLRKNAWKLSGILNGIDNKLYNPATDKNLAAPYDTTDLDGKRRDKLDLQTEMKLPTTEAPLFGVVSRLTDQKGMGLLLAALESLLDHSDFQIALLGTGDPSLEAGFERLQNQYPKQVAAALRFDVSLAQKIYAGADYFLMPSAFEPSGLAQMMAMRYGTPPIVHETGGLRDSVIAYNETDGSGTGFTFWEFTVPVLADTITRAATLYTDNPNAYRILQEAAMAEDFDWQHAATDYLAGYETLLPE